MKFNLAALATILAVAMAAPGVSVNAEPASEIVEKRCLAAGAVTTDFRQCCSGSGFADRGCACTKCL